mmetsp:Transcript_49121/g.86488  ORF Transcript_49121/g.86488 Transcript_49121/m.86488 type:complete len:81 (-) Transcript_49121:270-512(-)
MQRLIMSSSALLEAEEVLELSTWNASNPQFCGHLDRSMVAALFIFIKMQDLASVGDSSNLLSQIVRSSKVTLIKSPDEAE